MPIEGIPPELATVVGMAIAAVVAYFGGKKKEARRHVMDLESYLRELGEDKGLPSPTSSEAGRGDLEAALGDALPDGVALDDDIETVFADGTYFAVDPDDVSDLRLLASLQGFFPYRPERFDCENFAAAFKVLAAFVGGINAVGLVYDWSAGHAYNAIVTSDGSVIWYEPQDNKIVQIGQGDYMLSNGLIVF